MRSYDEDWDSLYETCEACEHKRDVIYSAKELVDKLVKQLYIEGSFDEEITERILDDLCHVLNVKTVYCPIRIEAKNMSNKNISIQKCA
jgi:hypothetical protein